MLLSQVTGSWTPDSQKWFVEAIVEISAGKHVVRLENPGPFPHIDKLCIAPALGRVAASHTADDETIRFAFDSTSSTDHCQLGEATELAAGCRLTDHFPCGGGFARSIPAFR